MIEVEKLATLTRWYTITPAPWGYMLTGKRGATYGLYRNQNNPNILYAVNASRRNIPSQLQGWFTDKTEA